MGQGKVEMEQEPQLRGRDGKRARRRCGRGEIIREEGKKQGKTIKRRQNQKQMLRRDKRQQRSAAGHRAGGIIGFQFISGAIRDSPCFDSSMKHILMSDLNRDGAAHPMAKCTGS